jgi:hypothetical protein
MKTNTTDRAAELREELTRAESDCVAARERLGIAIADADERAAKSARADVARAERLAAELRSAIPVAEARARKSAEAEAQRAQKAREKAANEDRRRRIEAARNVDAALFALGEAYRDYLNTAPGGRPEDRNRLARRGRTALASAMHHASPEVADALEVRRIASMHRQSLEAAQSFITEFNVEPEA